MKIPKNIVDKMIIQAQEGIPFEVCGILAGKRESVESIYPMKNRDASAVSFFMQPEEQLRVFKEIRGNGLELAGIYHSHPETRAYPSATDVSLAFYPEAVYVIISLKNREHPEVRGFRIVEG